ncbi:hypothetical protein [Azospirillum sp. SYSU D00513]|uniref:hypothetical protein n=1 Tax=Azospirillum sp. SYSU D00513 TaxID=2812561 RepID=UPI001A965FB9|nr:hypothetical protein [Azospirillum sp. SYSU D00513]
MFLKLSKNGVQLGTLDLVTQVVVGDELILRECHIHGLAKGAIGIEGLNAIAQALMEDFGVQSAVVEGGTRTTGLRRGKTPKPRRHVRRPYSSDAP